MSLADILRLFPPNAALHSTQPVGEGGCLISRGEVEEALEAVRIVRLARESHDPHPAPDPGGFVGPGVTHD